MGTNSNLSSTFGTPKNLSEKSGGRADKGGSHTSMTSGKFLPEGKSWPAGVNQSPAGGSGGSRSQNHKSSVQG